MATEQITKGKKPKKRVFKKLSKKQVIIILLFALSFFGLGGMAIVKASDHPAFCSTFCHNMEPMYNSYKHSNLLANAHAKADVVCHDCHKDSLTAKAQEGIKYVKGDYETPMKTRKFSSKMCLKCHDYDKVIAKTNFEESNPHKSHNGQLECNKCHKLHEPSTVYCSECHEFEWMDKLPAAFNAEE